MQDPDTPSQQPATEHPPDRGRRTPAYVPVLAFALAVSLATNVVVAVRLVDERARLQDAQTRLEEAEESLAALRGEIRGAGPNDPLAHVAAAVEKLRGLEFKERVEPELLTVEKLRERVRETFLRDNERAEIDASEKVIRALGIVPEDFDLWEALLAVQQEQVAGFYDSDEKELVVAAADANDPSPLARVILAHEYTHAVTDQHFDLGRLDRLWDDDKDDEAAAFQALVEGDAQFLMEVYQREVLTPDEQTALLEEARRIRTDVFDSLPRALQRIFYFPYQEGIAFVRSLHRRGGYAQVDEAYRNPPASTEQILHPNKYLDRRDDPVRVRLPDVASRLGRGWTMLEEGGLGEFDLRVIADDQAGTPGLSQSDARAAAEGWDGGRYAGFAAGDGVVVVALTAWDTEQEAREATGLFGRWLPLRYRNVGAPFDVGQQGHGWASDRGAGAVLRDGDRMLLLIGPDRATVERARGAFDGF